MSATGGMVPLVQNISWPGGIWTACEVDRDGLPKYGTPSDDWAGADCSAGCVPACPNMLRAGFERKGPLPTRLAAMRSPRNSNTRRDMIPAGLLRCVLECSRTKGRGPQSPGTAAKASTSIRQAGFTNWYTAMVERAGFVGFSSVPKNVP